MKRRYPGSRNPVVNSTNLGGRVEACVPNRMRGCLPPRSGCGCAATSSPRNALRRPVGMRVSQDSSAVSRAGTSLSLCQPVLAETAAADLGASGNRTVLLVSDGIATCDPDPCEVAEQLTADGLDLQVVSLSRNFGKEAALMAGLDHARRGAVLFMDGDGQHPPTLVEQLVAHWIDDGYDVVYTAKAHRDNESALRRLAVRGFYSLINWGARQQIPEDAGDFRLLSPRAAAALRQLPERNRFFKGLASWIGFKQIRVDYEPAPRAHGVTTFNAGRLIGLSIEGLTSFSVAPLRFASLLGALLAGAAFLFGLSILWEVLTTGKQVPGYPSLMIGVMTIGGVPMEKL